LSVGHVTEDLYPEGLRPGGSAYYGTLVYAALGADARILTRVGRAFAEESALAALSGTVLRGSESTRFRNRHDDEGRRTQWLFGRAGSLEPASFTPGPVDVLHLAPVLGELDPEAWVRAVPARVVALGVQGLIKGPGLTRADGRRSVLPVRWWPDGALLDELDVVCLSRQDLLAQDSGLLPHLVRHVPVVACTEGARGSTLFVNGTAHGIGVHPAREHDPTGAGDAFAAGLTWGVARGMPAVDAARLAAGVASIVVEAVGPAAAARVAGEAWRRAAAVSVPGERA
jgi:sugar/nucleoside kinase (ribokinase family)